MTHPFRDVTGFPTVPVPARLWRVVHVNHVDEPLWFGASGHNRFDLNPHGANGTCYLADDPYGALLETLLRDVEPTGDPETLAPLAPAETANHRVVTVEHHGEAVDLSGTSDPPADTHTVWGVTDALATSDNYELPQQWAQAFAAHDHTGIRYRLRHGNGRLGTAAFGTYGARRASVVGVERLGLGSIREWRDHTAAVIEPPHERDLDWSDD